ncbi:RusA family crossover junction endodeoxyribonuclease [Companilactobacillus metriopterae]|uniref:RusA family crossover junction endodeoxyribonuclease n=1 Tax=Companilactobacillus metriopterae TaxID=1909267 RepID=UPI001F51436A|nr:RusA family crossover junction endodeoxyribonuclease [Companilactobacillus metriopterae]
MELNLVINEIPVPASRPRVARWGTYIAEPYKSYKKYVEQLGKEQFKNKHFEQGIALSVDIKFYRPIQKSISKVEYSRRLNNEHLPTVKPDIDNYTKAILDGLNGYAWHDDNQIIQVKSTKLYSDKPRTEITIREYEHV